MAVDPQRVEEPVRRFGTFTDELEALADWLAAVGVRTVAMEATGVYWMPLYEVLDARGFELYLVNSRATRQVSGSKSDVLDCQWIWQLMAHGLLRKGRFGRRIPVRFGRWCVRGRPRWRTRREVPTCKRRCGR